MMKVLRTPYVSALALFVGVLASLLLTTAPTIFTTDSPELVSAAYTLGIPHAPGYPLYTLVAHGFTHIPLGEVAYRVNLFSALALAMSASLLAVSLTLLLGDRLVAGCAALIFAWSFFVWSAGVVGEVYAAQILTLTATGTWLAWLNRKSRVSGADMLLLGVLTGLAVAMHPASLLLAGGLALAVIAMKIPPRLCLLAGVTSVLVFAATLLYFPLRFDAAPVVNAAGTFNAAGEFEAVNLKSLSGIWWLVSGRQFEGNFFSEGLLPSVGQLREVLGWYWRNTLGFGLILGVAGAFDLFRRNRPLFWLWLACFAPYTYFYTTYGAPDRDTMFGPSYLLWAVVIAYGVAWFTREFPARMRFPVLVALPLAMLVINFPLVDASGDRGLHQHTVARVTSLPQEATVFGYWANIVPMEYLQVVEDQRGDLRFYNVFFFEYDSMRLETFVDHLLDEGQTVIFLGDAAFDLLDDSRYDFTALPSDPTITTEFDDQPIQITWRG